MPRDDAPTTAAAAAPGRVIIRAVRLKKHYVKKGVVTEALRGVDGTRARDRSPERTTLR